MSFSMAMHINSPLHATTTFANIFPSFASRASLLFAPHDRLYQAALQDFRACVRGIRLAFPGQGQSSIRQTCRADDLQPPMPFASAVVAKARADQAARNSNRNLKPALPATVPARPASSYRKMTAESARRSG